MSAFDAAFEDFPRTESWRLTTNAKEAALGSPTSKNQGMDAGFKFIKKNLNTAITPQLLEDLYRSAYQFEKEYQSNEILQRGYCESYHAYELCLPLPGLEDAASVSAAGIDELIAALKKAYDNIGERFFPQFGLYIETNDAKWPIIFNPNDYSLDECRQIVREHLLHASASKSQCMLTMTDNAALTRVEIAVYNAARAEILGWVQKDIDNYNQALKAAKAEENPELAILNVINQFIQKLYQSHYFPAKNDHTFVLLLANMLLLQNGYGLKLTTNPTHYMAFSSKELLQESLQDLANFNKYKITQAKNYLMNVEAFEINKDREGVQRHLLDLLSQDPLVAMAQINELYLRVEKNILAAPQNYAPDPGFFALFAKKTEPEVKAAHFKVLELLRDTYISKLEDLTASKDAPATKEILARLIEPHKIVASCDINRINQAFEVYGEDNQFRP